MSDWTKTDKDLAIELGLYVARVRLYGTKDRWKVGDKTKPWNEYYLHTSAIFRKMRSSRRRRVANSE